MSTVVSEYQPKSVVLFFSCNNYNMGRGRRKCAKSRIKITPESSDDLTNEAPKTKDSKLSREFKGKLSHSSPQISNNPITKYYHPAETNVLQCAEETFLITERDVQISAIGRTSPRRSNCNISPKDITISCMEEKKQASIEARSPHKIQLCDELVTKIPLSPSSALSLLSISQSPKRATKSRRRLNPSQIVNQQIVPKAALKFNCCISATTQEVPGNHKLTEYFPVRRSVRKTKRTVLEEQQRGLEEAILSQKEEGLEVVHNFEGKGRGIVTTRRFAKGEFVVEYAGELIDMCEAKEREQIYAQDQNTGCYMYYFKYKNNQYCIDATAESGRLGRLVNHSRNGNLITKTVSVMNKPHLVLIAKEEIPPGEEVMYDYGDRSKESLRYHPWLAT